MVDARMKLKPYTNRVLSVVKAKYDLKDKSDALNRFAEMYGPEEVEPEPKDSYVKKILAIVEDHHKKYGYKKMSDAELDKLFGKWHSMPFDYNLSEKLKDIIEKLRRKDPHRADILYKKIMQIVNSDEQTIEHYKNLKYSLKHLKRVHIDRNFVLTFQYDKTRKHILFADFDHHDNIYPR